jgi:hypothetical protein
MFIFSWFFKNICICKSIPLPPYGRAFGSNRHMVRRLEVLQCSKRHTTWHGVCEQYPRRGYASGVSSFFQKNHIFFMNLGGDKLYMEIVTFEFRRDLQLCSFHFFHSKSSSNSNNQYSIEISVFGI